MAVLSGPVLEGCQRAESGARPLCLLPVAVLLAVSRTGPAQLLRPFLLLAAPLSPSGHLAALRLTCADRGGGAQTRAPWWSWPARLGVRRPRALDSAISRRACTRGPGMRKDPGSSSLPRDPHLLPPG